MELMKWMEQGGAFMWPILLCALVGAGLALERAIVIYGRAGIDASSFLAAVQRAVLDGDIEGAVRVCNADPGAALPRVAKAGLIRAARPPAEIRSGLEEAQAEVFPMVNRRLGLLPMVANVSTLLGLLGTIQGLILSFHSVSEASSDQRSTALAEGIAVAMYTTYFGLLVAIPIMVAHGLIAGRANEILDDVDHAALKLANLLEARRPESVPPPAPDNLLPFRG
jgi:biopolymer transport protein ExbB